MTNNKNPAKSDASQGLLLIRFRIVFVSVNPALLWYPIKLRYYIISVPQIQSSSQHGFVVTSVYALKAMIATVF